MFINKSNLIENHSDISTTTGVMVEDEVVYYYKTKTIAQLIDEEEYEQGVYIDNSEEVSEEEIEVVNKDTLAVMINEEDEFHIKIDELVNSSTEIQRKAFEILLGAARNGYGVQFI